MWTYCKAKCCRAFGQTGNDYRKKNNIMLTFYNKLSYNQKYLNFPFVPKCYSSLEML